MAAKRGGCGIRQCTKLFCALRDFLQDCKCCVCKPKSIPPFGMDRGEGKQGHILGCKAWAAGAVGCGAAGAVAVAAAWKC